MKRLVALIFLLAVCGAGAAARPGAYRTVKNIAYRDAGVVGFDIAGAEEGYPPTRHLDDSDEDPHKHG